MPESANYEEALRQARLMQSAPYTKPIDPNQSQGEMLRNFFIQALTQAPAGLAEMPTRHYVTGGIRPIQTMSGEIGRGIPREDSSYYLKTNPNVYQAHEIGLDLVHPDKLQAKLGNSANVNTKSMNQKIIDMLMEPK